VITRIELTLREQYVDSEAQGIMAGARDLGITGIEQVFVFHVYYVQGNLNAQDKVRIAKSLLADGVTQEFAIDEQISRGQGSHCWSVEITFNRGVTDMVAETARKGILDLGITAAVEAKTAKRYEFVGDLEDSEKELVVQRLLMNKVVQHVLQPAEKLFVSMADPQFNLTHIPIRQSSDEELVLLSRTRDLFLNLDEMRAIQAH
jgi:phosphoribosylformylglycinamidine (FGAM) synthase PurS component